MNRLTILVALLCMSTGTSAQTLQGATASGLAINSGGVACSDGIDNDGDDAAEGGGTDYPEDLGCWGAADTDEEFPNASNTGVPAGTQLTTSAGTEITENGVTIDAMNYTSRLTINADNVTVKRTRVTGTGPFYGVIYIKPGSTGTLLEDVEVDGSDNTLTCIYADTTNTTIRRANVWGCEDGIELRNDSTIEYSYVHDLLCGGSCGGDPHYDGIEMNGGQQNVTIFHNHVNLDEHTQTAVIEINNYFGGQNNILVDNNLINGAGYSCYRDADFTANALNITYSNNKIVPCETGEPYGQHCISGTGWDFGSCVSRGPGTLTWTNNVSYTDNADYNQGDTIACPSP